MYLYDFLDSFKRLDEKELPSKENFYWRLNDENISDDDYKHAKNVLKDFKMNTRRD